MGSLPTPIPHPCWCNRQGTQRRTEMDKSSDFDHMATLPYKMENKMRHSQYSDSLASNFKREQILQQIQTLYTMKERLLQQHQYMFNTTLEEWESLPTTQLSEWILKYKPVIKACLNTAQLQLKENSSDIRKFYPSTATIPATKSKTTRRKTNITRRKYKQ
eukprot:scaffold177955_cov71-Attheya_sp.AAC.1